MKKILLFGATGSLGSHMARALKMRGYYVAIVARNAEKADKARIPYDEILIRQVTDRSQLTNICHGFDIVISALGKSVSPTDRSKASFLQVDLEINSNILEEALKSKVKKFVYISAFHSERYPGLEYFKVHHAFSEKLIASGLDYAIIKPPSLFSAYLEMIPMARKGQLVLLGKGDKKTNPIFEGDLAQIAIDSFDTEKVIIEAGGITVYTRKELANIIQQVVNPRKKVWSIPTRLIRFFLPLIKPIDRNAYDKFAFFTAVMDTDTIAPLKGMTDFTEYIKKALKTIR